MGPPTDDRVRPPRPDTVTYAVYLMIGGYAVATALVVADLVTLQLASAGPEPSASGSPLLLLCSAAVVPTVAVAIVYGIWKALNWSRILYAALLISALWNWIVADIVQSLSTQPVRTILSAATFLTHLTAAVLLFVPTSNVWFREVRAMKRVAKVTKSDIPVKSLPPDMRLADSRRRWVPLALSVALILLLSLPVYNSGLPMLFGSYLSEYDVWLCLPFPAIAMLLGALVGARRASLPSERWKGATYGVWIGGLTAIGLRICGMLAAQFYDFWQSL